MTYQNTQFDQNTQFGPNAQFNQNTQFDPNAQFNQNNPYGRRNNNSVLFVIIGVLCAIVIGSLAFIFSHILSEKKVPILNVTSCPSVVYAAENQVAEVYIEGTMFDEKKSCILKINGETIEISSAGSTTKWSASFYLAAGTSREFLIELVNDNDLSVSTVKSVYCEKVDIGGNAADITTPLKSGCEFVKKKPYGLNIRQYAGTQYKIVDYISKDDYTSKMIFVGLYQVDNEGYIWYEVVSPNGKNGYVRSDLVRRIN